MEQRKFIRDILNLNVVGNDVTFQPCAKHFAKLRIRIHQKSFAERGHENCRVQFAFRTEDACFDAAISFALRKSFVICPLIKRNLSVPITRSLTRAERSRKKSR